MEQNHPTVLLIASDTIGERMAGSGIRYWNLARVIGAKQPVTLATPNTVTLDAPLGVTVVSYGGDDGDAAQGRRLAELIERHEIIVAQHIPFLHTDDAVLSSRHLVIDLYAPWILEKLEYARIDPERGESDRKDDVTILNRLLQLGDFFLCASDRQRDFWLGALASSGRLSLAHAQADSAMRTLIDIVGFGLPKGCPHKTGPGPRETFTAIGPDDPLILWNGGMWNWLDPLTAIRAVGLLASQFPSIRLVFMGTRSPGAQVAEMSVIGAARQLADELNLLDRNVFFNDWVPFDERQNWLLEADATISLHVATLEARIAFRTRMLDNLWCAVPAVVTDGDVLAELVDSEGVGATVPPGDVGAVADALERVLDSSRSRQMRANLSSVATRFTWEKVAAPLLAYCREPWMLDDRASDPGTTYLRGLERLYTETAEYARRLEATVGAKDQALAELASRLGSQTRRKFAKPDVGTWFGRAKR